MYTVPSTPMAGDEVMGPFVLTFHFKIPVDDVMAYIAESVAPK